MGWNALSISAVAHLALGVVIAAQVGGNARGSRGRRDALQVEVLALASAPAPAATREPAASALVGDGGATAPVARRGEPRGVLAAAPPGVPGGPLAPAGNRWMQLRAGRPGRIDLAIPADAAPAVPARAERLPAVEPHPGFDPRIAPDGRVSFGADALRIEEAGIGCIGCDGVDAKGRKIGVNTGMPLGASGRFADVTDWSVRLRGGGAPYRHDQAKFLDDTRDQRGDLAAGAHTEQLGEALRGLRDRLHAIWADARTPAVERRRRLFQLWDECAETGSDETLAFAGAARATVIAFVRRELPAGSADAFTPAELERLNAQRESRQVFAPYQ